jgi:MFS family permease
MSNAGPHSSLITHHSSLSPAQGRRNVFLLGSEMSAFMAGMGLVAPLTLVPLFVSTLTDSTLAVGAVTAAFQLGWLPQVFVAGYVERSARKLPTVRLFTALERFPILGLAACAVAAPYLEAPLVLALVYLCCFSQTLGAGLATTPWADVIARVVPARRRGRFMGSYMMLGHLLGAGGAALAAPLLDWLPYPHGFAACFGLGFLILMACYAMLFMVIEPPGPPPRSARPFLKQLADLPRVIAADRPFRRFLSGLALTALGTMSIAGFLTVYAVSRLGATVDLAAWYTATLLASQVAANYLLGRLADRHGWTAVGQVAGLATVGLATIAMAAPTPLWLVGSFILLGFAQSGSMLMRLTGPIDYAPLERRPTYIGLGTGLTGLVSAVAPLLGGQLIATLDYSWLLGASMLVSLAGAALLSRGATPRKPHTAHLETLEENPA